MKDRNFELLQSFLRDYGSVEEDLIQDFLKAGRNTRYQKNEIICAAGDPVVEFSLIHSGIIRHYYCSPEGKEWNKSFFAEGEILVSASGFLTQGYSAFSTQALEDVELLTFPASIFDEIIKIHPSVIKIMNKMLITGLIINEQREAMLLTCSAEKKYQWLLKYQPHLLTRVPQFHLATYLGIDPVSLSRLKKKHPI